MYMIDGELDPGDICIDGAAAHLVKVGEEVIMIGFEFTDTPIEPRAVLVDRDNRFARRL